MKTFYRKTIALHISLAILFLTIGSAAAEVGAVETECSVETGCSVDIREPVYGGSYIPQSLYMPSSSYMIRGPITIDAPEFAAFSYEDNSVTTETIQIPGLK